MYDLLILQIDILWQKAKSDFTFIIYKKSQKREQQPSFKNTRKLQQWLLANKSELGRFFLTLRNILEAV